MIDLEIRNDGFYVDSLFESDNYNGKIILGSDLEQLKRKMFETHKHLVKESLKKYGSLDDLLDGNIITSLTHEFLHIVLFKNISFDACYSLDKIDRNYEVSRVSLSTKDQSSRSSESKEVNV